MDNHAWIQTHSGIAFFPFDPKPEMIDINDIAHALSMICRYNGHTKKFYSVAEHSVVMSNCVPKEHALATLIHDAAEAYIADLARPIKHNVSGYKEIEEKILEVIYEAFNAWPTVLDMHQILHADLRMLATERGQVMGTNVHPWVCLEGVLPYDIVLPCWCPAEAELNFLRRFYELRNPK